MKTEKEQGLLMRPSEKANLINSTKRPVFATGLLTILLVVSYVFTIKNYEPASNIIISGGILFYPLTFLIVAYISKYYGFKEARKSIFISVGLFVLFILLMMIGIIPAANNQTSSYNAVIQYLYCNDFFMVGNTRIFYPPLGQFFGVIIAFSVSHLLYATIYNAIHKFTIDYLAMGLSTFIGAIVDRIIFVPMLFLENLLDGSNTFEYFIKCLTSEFIATIIMVIVMIVLYIIVTAIKDATKRKRTA